MYVPELFCFVVYRKVLCCTDLYCAVLCCADLYCNVPAGRPVSHHWGRPPAKYIGLYCTILNYNVRTGLYYTTITVNSSLY